MPKNDVPTLSTSGWVGEISEKADRLTSYYFVSEHSQTNLYRDAVTSLPYQIQQFGHDEFELRQGVQGALSQYLNNYFDSVEVSADTSRPNPEDPNRITLTVSIIVTQDGVQYSLGRLIEVVNSKILNIIDINNYKGA